MGVRLPGLAYAKHAIQQSLHRHKKSSTVADVPKGHFPVYVGEAQRRFVVPVSYLRHPLFQNLLHRAQEEFDFDHGVGGIRVPCKEDAFVSLTSEINVSLE